MNYPYRNEDEQQALEHLPHSPYAFDDKPYLNTQRYSMSGYEIREVERKSLVDAQGAKDMQYSLEAWKKQKESL